MFFLSEDASLRGDLGLALGVVQFGTQDAVWNQVDCQSDQCGQDNPRPTTFLCVAAPKGKEPEQDDHRSFTRFTGRV